MFYLNSYTSQNLQKNNKFENEICSMLPSENLAGPKERENVYLAKFEKAGLLKMNQNEMTKMKGRLQLRSQFSPHRN
jgi:hypothetical protein